MAKHDTNELDFESLLQELGENSSRSIKGEFEFKELTMQDQRKILNMGFNPIEIPVRMSNMYNEYIKSSISLKDDPVNISRHVTVDIKPFLIVELRHVTLGDKYIDVDTNAKHTLRKVTDKDFKRIIEPTVITFGDFIIRLEVPTIDKDTAINNQLLAELGKFKPNSIKDEDYGKIADIYQMYEIMKYVTEIEFKGNVFDFAMTATNKKTKIINSLPQRVVVDINEYIESVKENENLALTMVNDETMEESKINMDALFYSKFARESKEHKK
jgi:hypothetical protein